MPAAAEKTLLVLEDGDKITQQVKPTFEKAGYEVITYKDATAVLVMARQIAPNVAILEGQLRVPGAVSALKSFARNVHMSTVPVIAVAGRTGPKPHELVAAGARACVDDPCKPSEVLNLAEEHNLGDLDFTKGVTEAVKAPERVAAVVKSKIIDSPPEEAYDRLTRVASRLLHTPVSLASFVAADRQFFKAETGLAGPWKERRGTPLSHSFCQWVVASRSPVVIDDVKRYRATRSNAAVAELGVVAYAGVPVVGDDNQAIGSMCAIDHDPRQWTPTDIETLQDLAVVLQSYAVRTPQRCGEALKAVTRTLRRYGAGLRADEREELLQIIDDQSARLAAA